jgi:hypothetical protein
MKKLKESADEILRQFSMQVDVRAILVGLQ